jgi:hypothetical protein
MLVCFSHSYHFIQELSFLPGVIKGTIGEITNQSNSADAFALLHVPWACGYAFGYVET